MPLVCLEKSKPKEKPDPQEGTENLVVDPGITGEKLMFHKSWKTIKCLGCSKEFSVAKWRVGRAKYCSFECSNKHRTTSKNYHTNRICAGCGKEFLPTQWYQKFCNRQCFCDSVRKKLTIECSTCGKKFRRVRVSQLFCSRKCSEPSKRKTFKKFRKGYADILWAELIKLKAGKKCEYCGKIEHLNSHHIFSRSNMGVRWDVDNGVCLCVGHHVFGLFSAHKAPLDFAEWLKEKRGEEWFNKLRNKSRIIVKLTDLEKNNITINLRETVNQYSLSA